VAGIGPNPYATPSGWTLVATQHAGSTATRLQVYTRTLTAGDVAHGSVTIPDISGDDAKVALIGTFGAGVLGSIYGSSSGSASTSVSIPSGATLADRALVVRIVAHDIDSATDNQATFEQSVGEEPIVQHVDLSTSQGSGSGIAIAAQERPVAGDFGSATATLASASTSASVVIVIEPAPVPDGRWDVGAIALEIDATGTEAWPRVGQCQIFGGLYSGEVFSYGFQSSSVIAFSPALPFASVGGEEVHVFTPGLGLGDSTESGHPVLSSYTDVAITGGRLTDVR
jgi:hypothetical protein